MSSIEYISSAAATSSVESITFDQIPDRYEDLILTMSVKINNSGHIPIRFNNDSGSNYSSTVLYGDGATVGSSRYTSAAWLFVGARGGISYQSNIYTPKICNILSYSNPNIYKSSLISVSQGNGAYQSQGEITESVALWRNTDIINSITLLANTGTSPPGTVRYIDPGSTFTLWGVK